MAETATSITDGQGDEILDLSSADLWSNPQSHRALFSELARDGFSESAVTASGLIMSSRLLRGLDDFERAVSDESQALEAGVAEELIRMARWLRELCDVNSTCYLVNTPDTRMNPLLRAMRRVARPLLGAMKRSGR